MALNKCVLGMYKDIYNAYMEDRHLIPKENLIEISFGELQADKIGTVRQ